MYTNGAVRGNIAPNNTKLSEQTCDHNGCQAQIGDKICGETDTLEITREFRQLYEDKLKEIDSVGGGDCVQVREIPNIQIRNGRGCGLCFDNINTRASCAEKARQIQIYVVGEN